MDKKIAAALLASLLERIESDKVVGAASTHERQALKLAIEALGGESYLQPNRNPEGKPPNAIPAETSKENLPELKEVELDLTSIRRNPETAPEVLMCLDFGTAMSKAFAQSSEEYYDLELGVAAGREGYTLPSSVFITNDGKVYFGFDAIDKSEGLENFGRERLDSIKSWISLQQEVTTLDGDADVLPPPVNPTGIRLTKGDMLRLYLAYLSDMAEIALPELSESRYVKRRYARPCWRDDKVGWGENLMRRMLAEAQILADTFNGQWSEGISVAQLKSTVDKIKKLDVRPEYLIADGVPEPVAVATSAIADSENVRDAFMVVDAGAGTTDFGLFISTKKAEDGESRVFQNPFSIRGRVQAGDTVDRLLRGFIAHKESIDSSDSSGKMILAELSRRIRGLKEILFKTGELEYTLSDDTVGKIRLDEFLADDKVKRFGQAVEQGFKDSLEAVDDTWLRWLAMDEVRLHVVLTGGSSKLPMIQALGKGVIEVKGHKILREVVDPTPEWMEDMPDELLAVYPQLAVAIGGSAETIPETHDAPLTFGGGTRAPSYVAGNIHIGGR